MKEQNKSRVVVALDYDTEDAALSFVDKINPNSCRLKVGKGLFTTEGPAFVEKLTKKNFDVFLDLKFHDIPNTVAHACKAAADLGVWMVNVHAQGGRRMLDAARESLANTDQAPLLIAVTVLTSMSNEDLKELGVQQTVENYAVSLAALAHQSGLDGVVCSAHEAKMMKQQFGKAFQLVTPGIRTEGTSNDDQRRIMTPVKAIQQGSDYLVIGRSITQATNPVEILEKINTEIDLLCDFDK